MRRKHSESRLLLGFCILLLMAFFANLCFAQGEEAPQQLYEFSYVQVKPGMELEFEELVKNKIPFFKKMGLTQMDVLKISNFGVSGKYLVVSPLQDAAAMDAELSAPQTNVPVEIVSLLSGVSRMIDSSHNFMLIPQPDLNIPPADDYETKLVVNITVGTAPGREEDFLKNAKIAMEAIGRTNVKGVLIGKVGLGGSMDEYIVHILYDSFTEMTNNEPAIQKELAAADLTPLTGVVYYRETQVFVRIPELSVQPAAQ